MILPDIDLINLFKDELHLCNVRKDETVLIFTDPKFKYPLYGGAALSASKLLGAQAYILATPSDTELSSEFVLNSWKQADMVIGITSIPWLYTDAHNEALAQGTRTLLIEEPIENLRRLFPCEDVTKRTYAGARRIACAREIRVTDDSGSDFVMLKEGRKGHAQVGVADKPGRWDHWPSGLVACAPLEDSAEGVYVINPGDILLHFKRHATAPIHITLHEGLITKIEGGYEATMLREFLEKYDDPDAYRISHAGWGTDHRANWNVIGMDSESFYGSVMVSLGSNMFNAKEEFSGLGGTNHTKAHFDICCRNKRLYLDGELIIDKGSIVNDEMD